MKIGQFYCTSKNCQLFMGRKGPDLLNLTSLNETAFKIGENPTQSYEAYGLRIWPTLITSYDHMLANIKPYVHISG